MIYAYSVTKETYSKREDEKFYHLYESDIINICSSYSKAQKCLKEYGILNNKEYEVRMFPIESYTKRWIGEITNSNYKEIWEVKQWEL